MKFLKIIKWWILFTIIYGLGSVMMVLVAPSNNPSGPFAMSTRQATQIFLGTYGVVAYIIFSVGILIGSYFLYRKK